MARGSYDPDDDLDDEAPWLAEGVREPRASTMVPRGRVIGSVLVAVALLVLIGLGVFLISSRKQDGSTGFKRPEDAPLIAADPGPYKLAPTDPGGATVGGITDAIAAAGRGDDPGGAIDTTAEPEEPLTRPGTVPEPPTDLLPPVASNPAPVALPPVAPPQTVRPVPVPTPVKPAAPVLVKPVPAVVPPSTEKPKPKPAVVPPVKPPAAKPVADPLAEVSPAKPEQSGGPASLQLGAFSTEAKADNAWSAAVGRVPALGGLSKRVEPVERDGKTLYRLRAGGVASKAAATDLCARVKAGGDACLVAN